MWKLMMKAAVVAALLGGLSVSAASANSTITQANAATEPIQEIVVKSATIQGNIGYKIDHLVEFSGGVAPYVISARQDLIKGLTIQGNRIVGYPEAATQKTGIENTITVTDSLGNTGSAVLTFVVQYITVPDKTIVGKVGVPLSIPIEVTGGGTQPFKYSLRSFAPSNFLAINGDRVEGTPSSIGKSSVYIVVSDRYNQQGMAWYTVDVQGDVIIDDAALAATVNQPYSHTFSASGGKAPYTFQKHTGAFPDGLTLSGDTLSGTPTSVSTHQFEMRVTDANGVSANKNFDIEVKGDMRPPVAGDITLSVGSRKEGVWVPFDVRDHITNFGDPADTLNIKTLSTPDMKTHLSGLGGQIYVPISAVGAAYMDYTVSNSVSSVESNVATIEIKLGSPEVEVSLSQHSVPIVGHQYVARFEVSGGASPYIYRVQGDIPNGLTWSEISNTGNIATFELSGVPTTNGKFAFDLAVNDANGFGSTISHTIDLGVDLSVSDATANVAYGETVSVDLADHIDGTFQTIQLTTSHLSGSASLSGTVVTYTSPDSTKPLINEEEFIFTAFNASGKSESGKVQITIEPPAIPIALPFTVTADRMNGVQFNLFDHYQKGFFEANFAHIANNPSSGTLLPLGNGIYDFRPDSTNLSAHTVELQFTIHDSYFVSTPATITIQVPERKVISLQGALITGKVGEPISHKIRVNGGVAPYMVAPMMGFPTGLSINGDIIEGNPEKDGIFTIILGVRDSEGTVGNGIFRFEIAPADVVINLPAQTFNGKVGDVFPATTISATGGTAPYSYALKTGALPAGLDFNDGELSGTPTVEGTFTFVVEATDANGVVGDGSLTVEIALADAAVVVELPDLALKGKAGNAFSQVFDAIGGKAPYTYALTAGALPDGLSILDNTVSGTPTVDGTFAFTVEATDADGVVGSKAYTLTVDPADAIPLPTATDGALMLEYGETGQISLANLVTGDVDAITITSQPTKGTVSFDGVTATYVPNSGAIGGDQFAFQASNVTGVASGTVTIMIKTQVGDAPIAQNHVVHLNPLESGSVLTTHGAVSVEPITKVHLLNAVFQTEGTTKLFDKELKFTPHKAFSGQTVVNYQLENRWGRSNIARITFMVAPRPDPSEDPEVIGLLTSQVQDAKALANDQEASLTRRNEAIRNEVDGERTSSMNWTVGMDRRHEGDRDADGNLIEVKDRESIRGEFKSHEPFAIWTDGYVRIGENEFGGADFKSTAIGFTAGADYRFSPEFVGGVAVGYGRQVTDIGSNGTRNEATAITGALYGTWHNQSGAFVDGVIGYQSVKMDSKRFVTANEQFAYGSRHGNQVFGSLIAGYQFKTENGFKLEPYAGVRGVFGQLSSFSETGGDHYGLSYGTTDVRSFSGVAGVRVEKQFDLDTFTITPSAKLEYRHEFADASLTAVGYTDLGTLPYLVRTEGESRNSVAATVGIKVKPKDTNLTLETNVQATKSASSKSVSMSVKATYEICAFGAKEGDCMSREEKIKYFKAELEKAKKSKNKARIAKVKKLLENAEAALVEWKTLTKNAKPLHDLMYVDTISGKPDKR